MIHFEKLGCFSKTNFEGDEKYSKCQYIPLQLFICSIHMPLMFTHFLLVPVMVVSQDKFVEPALWGANHPLQTGMRTNSFVPPNVQNNLFIPGGW